jgi:hypothetical protein
MRVGGRRPDAAHPGRACSPDCAEFGCASWTACDPAIVAERDRERMIERYAAGARRAVTMTRDAAKHAASHAERGKR